MENGKWKRKRKMEKGNGKGNSTTSHFNFYTFHRVFG